MLKGLFGRKDGTDWNWIEADALRDALKSAAPPMVIDVRRPDEFTGPLGHIEGARNIPVAQIPTVATELLRAKQPIVLVCHTDRRSASGAAVLARAGGKHLAVLRGGMSAWQAGNN